MAKPDPPMLYTARTVGELVEFIQAAKLPSSTPLVFTGLYGANEGSAELEIDEGVPTKCPEEGCTHTHKTRQLVLHTGICTG